MARQKQVPMFANRDAWNQVQADHRMINEATCTKTDGDKAAILPNVVDNIS